MWDAVFTFLFKYRPLLFERGELVWQGWASAYLLAGAAVAAALVALTYATVRGRARTRDRLLLAALRLGVLAVVLVVLLRPVLRVPTVVPQRNFVGVLLDDSKSMTLADDDAGARSAALRSAFADPASPVLAGLADRFALRFFRFSDDLTRVASGTELGWAGTRTDLAAALEGARAELGGVPLAGLVVVTDGADNARGRLADALVALRAHDVPVYTVGIGRERPDRDIQIGRVETPAVVLKGASLAVDLVVAQTGYDGRTVPVLVEDDGRVLAREEVTLAGDGRPTPVRLRFDADDVGPRRLRFRVPVQSDERVAENNAQDAVVDVRDRREKVLYVEGEPRFEVKFIRRAVADDPNLQVVVLQRTAENKFLRLDVDSASELLGGFPRTREELFDYRAIILGSVEASFFTLDQLRMIEEFVDRRGGGLLALGGRHALDRGGYAGTPVADALPVVVGAEPGGGASFAELRVSPTRAGLAHPATRLAETEAATRDQWSGMPAVSAVNRVDRLKPGATALLTAPGPGGRDQVVLAAERYGRGRTAALTIQDSWLWQMDATVPLDDATHETFWRHLLRWLVDDVPGRVVAGTDRDRVEPGAGVEVRALVEDAAFLRVNNALVRARATAPSGAEHPLTLDWTVEDDGAYAGRLVPDEPGVWTVAIEAARDGDPLGGDTVHLSVGPSTAEFFDAGLRKELLQRVARETGGRFYTTATVGTLPEDLRYTARGATTVDELELWDMPILFFLLMALLTAEWSYRRARGLA